MTLRVFHNTLITAIRVFNAQELAGNQLVQTTNSVSRYGAKNLVSLVLTSLEVSRFVESQNDEELIF